MQEIQFEICCVLKIRLLFNMEHLELTFQNCWFYESKFILDSFIFWVFPARFLRRLAANVNLLPRSRVCSCDLFGFDTVRFKKWLASFINIFTWSHDILMLKLWNKRTENVIPPVTCCRMRNLS